MENYADQFLGAFMDYDFYPHPELAKMMDEVKHKPATCCACNPREHFVIPALCEKHYAEWAMNSKRFEKLYYNGKEHK